MPASGYSQGDVRSLAGMLTGWTYDRPGLRGYGSDAPGTRSGAELFRFEADGHEPGAKSLLGHTFAQDGVAQGEAALEMLARHPSTARFIATRLARHYVADTPPTALMSRLADVFSRTEGDLGAVFEALVDSPEAWAVPLAKYKAPEDYMVGLLRAIGAPGLPQGPTIAALDQMGQRPYAAPGPNG